MRASCLYVLLWGLLPALAGCHALAEEPGVLDGPQGVAYRVDGTFARCTIIASRAGSVQTHEGVALPWTDGFDLDLGGRTGAQVLVSADCSAAEPKQVRALLFVNGVKVAEARDEGVHALAYARYWVAAP